MTVGCAALLTLALAGIGTTTAQAATSADPATGTSATGTSSSAHTAGVPSAAITYRAAAPGRTVALTFDDGPGTGTAQVLDLLAQYHVKATFCEIGNEATAHPDLVKRVLAEGHRLCDHTVDHPQPMRTLPYERQAYEITAAKQMITAAGGPGTLISWFRAPGGDFAAANREIAVKDGLRPLGWTVDPRDWSRPGVASIVATVKQELRPGGIVLMHDGGGDRSQTVAALRELLPWMIAQGYTFSFPTT